ncbi:hypothetical protein CRV24_007462 [Beauveria bassiana]|nr:hypothetical protein CRV24_007462 [Beauveria bassiana]
MQVRMEGMGNKNNALKDELQVLKQQHDANLEELNNVQESLTTVRSFLVPLRALDETGRVTISIPERNGSVSVRSLSRC